MRILLAVMVSVLFLAGCGQLTAPLQVNAPSTSAARGASTYTYNRAFITVDETTQLYYGMTPQSVMSLCGKPLYVGYGSRDRVIWIYQVRELGVGALASENRLVKTSDITQIWDPLHFFGLTFENNALACWAPVSFNQIFDSAVFGDLLPVEEQEEEED